MPKSRPTCRQARRLHKVPPATKVPQLLPTPKACSACTRLQPPSPDIFPRTRPSTSTTKTVEDTVGTAAQGTQWPLPSSSTTLPPTPKTACGSAHLLCTASILHYLQGWAGQGLLLPGLGEGAATPRDTYCEWLPHLCIIDTYCDVSNCVIFSGKASGA